MHCTGSTADAVSYPIQTAGKVDLVLVDSGFKGACLHAAAGHLKTSAKVLVRNWDSALRTEVKDVFEVEDVVVHNI